MAIVKVIQRPQQIWSEVTYEGKVEVNGTLVEFRFRENDNGTDFSVWDEDKGKWLDVWPDTDDIYGIVYNACLAENPEEWSDQWDSEDYDDYL